MAHPFEVSNFNSFDLPFPTYQEPKEIGNFSLDANREFVLGSEGCKYLILPADSNRVRFDLNKGYEQAIKKNFQSPEKLDNLLKWFLNSKQLKTNLSADFVCYRGLLSLLLCTPYEKNDGWIICATKYDNIIYLCQYDTPEKIEREQNATDREKRMSSWGYKFEQYLSSTNVSEKPNVNEPVNENEEFCAVVRTRLNSHILVFGAEMDCVSPSTSNSSSMSRYVELKTNRIISSQRQERNFQRYKLLKWWSQSFLIGIREIVCGFRDDEGIVHNVETFPLKEIPKSAKGMWNPNVCMNFCEKFLSYVKQCVMKSDPR
uniref:Decapping nuclease n=1 Tax=Strigamia maritima TaxID=126957 RepID=T1JH46_STRMM